MHKKNTFWWFSRLVFFAFHRWRLVKLFNGYLWVKLILFFMAALYIWINIHIKINSYTYNSRCELIWVLRQFYSWNCVFNSIALRVFNANLSLYLPFILVNGLNLYWMGEKKNKKLKSLLEKSSWFASHHVYVCSFFLSRCNQTFI